MTLVIVFGFAGVGLIAAVLSYILNMTKKNQNTNTG